MTIHAWFSSAARSGWSAKKDPLSYQRWQLWLVKCLDREHYHFLKDQRFRTRFARNLQTYSEQSFRLVQVHEARTKLFKHSGNAGDIIYALPTLKALAGAFPAQVQLALDRPLGGHNAGTHPLGGVMLNRKMFELLGPLLRAQPYIESVVPYGGEPVDYDLDVFRSAPLLLDRMNLCRVYFLFFGISSDLSKPWLSVAPDHSFADQVVLARSTRYRNMSLDYRFLATRRDLVFVGLEEEYSEMRHSIPKLEWVSVRDFRHLAEVIAGCRLFIGNQSLPFAIAEALKVPRILESDPLSPNVLPIGGSAWEAMFQKQFEQLVSSLTDGSTPPSSFPPGVFSHGSIYNNESTGF